MKTLNENQNIVASNKLVRGRYKLTKEEQNFIYLMISQIDKDDKDFFEYKIHISDLESRELTQKNYKQYRQFAINLSKKGLLIEDNKRILSSNWFSSIEYIKNTGYIYACFDPKLKPYFLELKNEFVKAKLPILLQFKSKYSSRLYLLLKADFDRQKRYKFNLYINYKVLDLLNRFELPKSYLIYANLKIKFLDKSIKEINEKTLFNISYKELKTGRKITGIQFCINEKEKSNANNNPFDYKLEQKQEDWQKPSNDMVKQGLLDGLSKSAKKMLIDDARLKHSDLVKIFQFNSIDDINDIAFDLDKIYGTINNKQAWVRSRLKSK